MIQYTAQQIVSLQTKFEQLEWAQNEIRIHLATLGEKLMVSQARVFATEGLGRRIKLIERAVSNVFAIFPPGRTDLLTLDECDDIALQFQSFGMHVYALFDNIAWVCLLEAGGELPPMKVGALKLDCQKYFPEQLRAYLMQTDVKAWFENYGKMYRDSTAHRIPPYLPSRSYTPRKESNGKGFTLNRYRNCSGPQLLTRGLRGYAGMRS